MGQGKTRLDLLLVERGLAPSRHKAQALIMSGNVLVADMPVDKPGSQVLNDAPIRIRGEVRTFVSRGGEKLEAGLAHFNLDINNLTVLDLGASTGGFTDCMLRRGARLVYAVDVGYNQLDHSLRVDPRVVVREKVNAKDLQPEQFDPAPQFLAADLSFIGLRKVLPAAFRVMAQPFFAVVLVKPQFELEREDIESGGVVRNPAKQRRAIELVERTVVELGGKVVGSIPSPIRGEKKGNQEFLLCFQN